MEELMPCQWLNEAASDWSKTTLGSAPFGKLGKALKPVIDLHGWTRIRPAWQLYLKATEPKYLSAAAFARDPRRWLENLPKPRPVYHAEPEVRQPLDVAKLREMVK